jgi:mannitol/fructose-specific phosphotransferase system IIA component (Ntr-type)
MPCEILPAGKLVSIADYTRPELIVPQLRERDPAGIIEELSQRLRTNGIVGDMLSFYQAVVNHEFLSSSALPSGIATPHARSAQVSRLTLAIGRAREPVVWGISESWSVEYVFLLAVPSTEAMNHLALLSGIAGLGRQPEMLARLHVAADAQEIIDLLKETNVRPG